MSVLPTLLATRRRSLGDLGKPSMFSVAPLDVRDGPIDRTCSQDSAFHIKNTFVETCCPESPTFAEFYREREVQSCPSDRAGCLGSCFEDIASISTETPGESPLKEHFPSCEISTPTADDLTSTVACASMAPTMRQEWVCHPGLCIDYYYQLPMPISPEEQWMPCPAVQEGPCTILAPVEPGVASPCIERNRTVVCLADLIEDGSLPDLFAESSYSGSGGSSAEGGFQVSTETKSDDSLYQAGPALLLSMFGRAPVHPPAPPVGPAPGSEELPSIGSASHESGDCKPCAFLHTKGCEKGPACQFCHACGPEERRRRRREKMDARQVARAARKAASSQGRQ